MFGDKHLNIQFKISKSNCLKLAVLIYKTESLT